MALRPLGRRAPTDFTHIEKYPLTVTTAPTKPVPVTMGINWYSDFDTPQQDKSGKWWVGRNPKNLGSIRGGHCVCLPWDPKADTYAWYTFYNQGSEGACVGFGSSRMMSLLNRKTYDARWLWNQAKIVDEWPDTNPGDDNGTSVRAAMDILRMKGHVRNKKKDPLLADGINANRWATNIDDLFSVLQNDQYKKISAIPFVNSWGKDYPRVVWVPCETLQRLMTEDGEFTMVTDR